MQLEPCPDSPNCVSSQADASDEVHHLAAVPYTVSGAEALEAAAAAITSMPRSEIVTRTGDRVDAVFTSRVFRFKDDVVFAIDDDAKLLHFRSASRTGHSDLGVNRKRVEALLAAIRPRL